MFTYKVNYQQEYYYTFFPSENSLNFASITDGPTRQVIDDRRNNSRKLLNSKEIVSINYIKDTNDFEIGRIKNQKITWDKKSGFFLK